MLKAERIERLKRLERVIAAAKNVLEDNGDAAEWLFRPHPELENRSPLEVATTEQGARRVEEILGRLLYGLPARNEAESIRLLPILPPNP